MGMDQYFHRSKPLKLSVPSWDIVNLSEVENWDAIKPEMEECNKTGIVPSEEEMNEIIKKIKTNMVNYSHANSLLQEIISLDADYEHHEYFRKLLLPPSQGMFDSYTLYKVSHEQMRKYLKILRQINANHRLARLKLPIPVEYQRKGHKYDECYFYRIERLIASLENIDTDCQYYFSASY